MTKAGSVFLIIYRVYKLINNFVTTFVCSVHAEGGKGASVRGAFVLWGILSRGLLSGGASVPGGLCPGGLCPTPADFSRANSLNLWS